MGRELLAKGKYGDAKEMLEAAIKLDKKQAEPHIEMARMYIAMNEKGKSIASAKQGDQARTALEPGVEHEGTRRAQRA